MSADYPDDLKYSKDHEWARVDGKSAVIGITKFAVDKLGDVTMVELPSEGATFGQGDIFGTVESVKAVSDLFCPVSGKVLKVNSPLAENPEYVNEEPYDEGWMVEIEIADTAELGALMSAKQYLAFLKEQEED